MHVSAHALDKYSSIVATYLEVHVPAVVSESAQAALQPRQPAGAVTAVPANVQRRPEHPARSRQARQGQTTHPPTSLGWAWMAIASGFRALLRAIQFPDAGFPPFPWFHFLYISFHSFLLSPPPSFKLFVFLLSL